MVKEKKHLSLFSLRWAGYALVLLLPLSMYRPSGSSVAPGILDLYATPVLYLSDVVVGIILLAGLLNIRPHRRRRKLSLTVPLLTLAGLAILTTPWALSPGLAAYTALRWLVAAGVYFELVQSDLPIKPLVTVFLVGLGFQTLIGLGQVLRQGPLGLPGELALGLNRLGASVIMVGETPWLRAYGLTFHPNVFGGFLMAGLLLGLPLLTQRPIQILWCFLGVGLLLSFSRSAWLATALTLPPTAGWLAWHRPALRRPLGVIFGGVIVIMVVGSALLWGQIQSRVGSTAAVIESRSWIERGELIAVALDLIAERPLTGVGAGNFSLAMLAADSAAIPQPVHNVPLLLAAEVGLVGGGLWFWLWLGPWLALDRPWHDLNPWFVVLIGAWFGLGVISLWDSYPWGLNAGRLLTVTLLALISRTAEGVT